MKVKAMVTKGVEKIELNTFPYPKVQDDAILVKMKMAGICGTDPHIYHGRLSVNYPIIQGHENIGVVEEIGKKALEKMKVVSDDLKEGDRITWFPAIKCGKCWYCTFLPHNNYFSCENPITYGLGTSCRDYPHLFGGLAEFVYLLPGTWIYKIPNDLPDEIAVLIDVFNVPRLERAQAPNPAANEGFNIMDTIVVQGSGPVGVATAIRAKLLGAEAVIMTGAPQHRLELAKKFGVDYTINIQRVSDWKERVKKILDLTNGRGADMVVEASGDPSAFREGLEMVRTAGVYYELGCATDTGTIEINPYTHFCSKNIYLYGQYGTPPQEYLVALKILGKYKGRYPFHELVTDIFDLEDALEAMRAVESLECMKAVVRF